MSEAETSESLGGGGKVVPFPKPAATRPVVSFDRDELRTILNLYGRMVAAGEWRDYAIDFATDRAVFSVYRRASEAPLFRVVKDPKLARRQGAYHVETTSGFVLRRGHDLGRVLRALENSSRMITS